MTFEGQKIAIIKSIHFIWHCFEQFCHTLVLRGRKGHETGNVIFQCRRFELIQQYFPKSLFLEGPADGESVAGHGGLPRRDPGSQQLLSVCSRGPRPDADLYYSIHCQGPERAPPH